MTRQRQHRGTRNPFEAINRLEGTAETIYQSVRDLPANHIRLAIEQLEMLLALLRRALTRAEQSELQTPSASSPPRARSRTRQRRSRQSDSDE